MYDTIIETLSILTHYFKLGHNGTVADHVIREAEGDDRISDRASQNWCNRFQEGDSSSVVNLQDLNVLATGQSNQRGGSDGNERLPTPKIFVEATEFEIGSSVLIRYTYICFIFYISNYDIKINRR